MEYCDQANLAQAESSFFSLAARCFRRPDRALAALLAEGFVSGELRNLVACESGDRMDAIIAEVEAFEGECCDVPADDARLRLEVDYNRLFVGPAALLAPPYESYYASRSRESGGGRLRTAEERAVVAEYRRHGYAVPEPIAELPDHIAVELEFISLLAGNEAAAWEAEHDDGARSIQRSQAGFIEEHLGIWAADFSARVAFGSRTTFYPAMAALVEAYCA